MTLIIITAPEAGTTRAEPRWATPRTPARKTYGAQVERAAKLLTGRGLMPWQRYVADVSGEVLTAEECEAQGLDLHTPHLAYSEAGLLVPRQSGKTTLTLARQTARCQRSDRARCIYTAQTRHDARMKFEDEFFPMLKSVPEFAGQYRERKASGSEGVVWADGSLILVGTPGESGGHGLTLDDVTLDEAFYHRDDTIEQGYRPTMITRPNSQLWVKSTAGHPAKALYLKSKRDNGRRLVESGITHGVCYFEWSAADDDDPADEEVWRRTMPALGFTQTIQAVRAAFLGSSLSVFRRAFLNQWVEDEADTVLNVAAWASCCDLAEDDRELVFEDPPAFVLALDVSPSRDWACIGAAGRAMVGDRPFVEAVDHRPGTEWVVERCAELYRRYRPVAFVVDHGSPAASLIDQLERAGVDVDERDVTFMARACGNVKDAISHVAVRHRNQVELNRAVANAETRPLGDAWAWSRKASGVDITPLVSVTLALEEWAQSLDAGSSAVG